MEIIECSGCGLVGAKAERTVDAHYQAKKAKFKQNRLTYEWTCPYCTQKEKNKGKTNSFGQSVKGKEREDRYKSARKELANKESNGGTQRIICAFQGCTKTGTDCHHIGGREVDRIDDKKLLKFFCHAHHMFLHNNPAWAMKNGYMVSKHKNRDES